MYTTRQLSKRALLILLFLVACGGSGDPAPSEPNPTNPGPTEPGPAVPEPVEDISGVVEGWNAANGTYVHFASYGKGDAPRYFSAPISAEGAFSVDLTELSPEGLTTPSLCGEEDILPEFKVATISLGEVSSQAEPQEGVPGRIFLGNNYEFFVEGSAEAKLGDRHTEWWYSDRDVAFSEACEDFIYAVEFEEGWNLTHTIVESIEGDTVTFKIETGPLPEDVSWIYISR